MAHGKHTYTAKEALALSAPAEFRGELRVIRVSRTTRESMEV